MFENIGIVLKNNPTTKDISVVNSIIDILSKNTKNIFSEEGSNLSSSHIVEHKDDVFKNSIDLLIVCGGDGTLLAAARKFVNEDFPILGINLGTLGFLAEINVDDFELAIKDIFNGDYAIEERSLVEAHFSNNEVFGLNEILIHSGSYAQLMRYRLLIDNKTVYEQRSDGLIIATPTGSSAYALSAGGSIIHPELDLWNIIPMMSQSLSSRPLIVSNNKIYPSNMMTQLLFVKKILY